MKQAYEFDHWLSVVQQDGLALDYVPDHLKTPDLCRTADQGL